VLGFAAIMALLFPGTAVSAIRGGTILGLLLLLLVATGTARRLGSTFRRLAEGLFDEEVSAPPPLRTGDLTIGRLRVRLRDGASWRAVAYMLLKLPVAVLELFALSCWASAIDMASIFAKLGLPISESDNRRVLAVLRYLEQPHPAR
jgi:hypothetical protein